MSGKTLQTISIFGLGGFGKLITTLLPHHVRVLGHDPAVHDARGVEIVDLQTAASADVIIFAIPLSSLEPTLEKIKPYIKPETLLIDVCSVKVAPELLYEKHFPGHENILLTHPLFGPQSAAKHTSGHKLIVTKSEGKRAKDAIAFCKHILKLKVNTMSSDEHDQVMARIHALTFFTARGLSTLQLKDEPLTTPSYEELMDLVSLDHHHSDELFLTIEQGNPYAAAIRKEFIAALTKIDATLEK